jgi:hypothetical protein
MTPEWHDFEIVDVDRSASALRRGRLFRYKKAGPT